MVRPANARPNAALLVALLSDRGLGGMVGPAEHFQAAGAEDDRRV